MLIQGNIRQRHSHRIYDGRPRYFRLLIHPDVADFRTAAQRYAHADFSEALGCCHPAPVRERYDRRTKTWYDATPRNWGGVIRLVAGHVTTEVVAHEMAHAALVIYRMDLAADVRLSNGCRRREEQLAYILGDLVASAGDELHRLGAWS